MRALADIHPQICPNPSLGGFWQLATMGRMTDHDIAVRATGSTKDATTSTGARLVSEMIPPFMEYLQVEEGRSRATLTRYRAHLERWIAAVGDCAVTEINAERISLLKRRLMDDGCGPATIASIISGLRSFLRFLKSVRGLPVYDAAEVRRPKIPKREVDYLSPEEVQRFFDAIPARTPSGLRDRVLAQVLFTSGMRISEALGLSRADIDWDTREAQIIGKGNKQRKVYFSEIALDWVREYLRYRHDLNPALFVTNGEDPQRLQAQGTWRRFKRYAKLAGMGRRVYPHMFRHTMATTLLANGCPIGHIRALLGHEHLTTTCRYYLGIISDKEAKRAHETFMAPQEVASQRRGAEEVDEETDVTLQGR